MLNVGFSIQNREKGKPIIFQSLYNHSKQNQLLKADLLPQLLFQREDTKFSVQIISGEECLVCLLQSIANISANALSAFLPQAINIEFCFIC